MKRMVRFRRVISNVLIINFFSIFSENVSLKTVDTNGNIGFFKKSTLVWLLNDKQKLTNDRLKRYIYDQNQTSSTIHLRDGPIYKEKFIKRGDLIIMEYVNGFILGEVLNFQHMNEKTFKKKRYASNVCNVDASNVGVQATSWYLIKENQSLQKLVIFDYIKINDYIYHLNEDFIDLQNLQIFDEVIEKLYSSLIEEDSNE